MQISPIVELTEDGSQTLIHPIFGDSYHSLSGAVGESMHVYIQTGMLSVPKPNLAILEVGFGSGLNAILTLEQAALAQKNVNYTTLELYPISVESAANLQYAERKHFVCLHTAPWGEDVAITPHFSLRKEQVDILDYDFGVEQFDVVYFDAFAPDTQPQLWSEGVFAKIYNSMQKGGVLVTYSSKGIVKQALRSAGFTVTRLAGFGNKRHILRATKK